MDDDTDWADETPVQKRRRRLGYEPLYTLQGVRRKLPPPVDSIDADTRDYSTGPPAKSGRSPTKVGKELERFAGKHGEAHLMKLHSFPLLERLAQLPVVVDDSLRGAMLRRFVSDSIDSITETMEFHGRVLSSEDLHVGYRMLLVPPRDVRSGQFRYIEFHQLMHFSEQELTSNYDSWRRLPDGQPEFFYRLALWMYDGTWNSVY